MRLCTRGAHRSIKFSVIERLESTFFLQSPAAASNLLPKVLCPLAVYIPSADPFTLRNQPQDVFSRRKLFLWRLGRHGQA